MNCLSFTQVVFGSLFEIILLRCDIIDAMFWGLYKYHIFSIAPTTTFSFTSLYLGIVYVDSTPYLEQYSTEVTETCFKKYYLGPTEELV